MTLKRIEPWLCFPTANISQCVVNMQKWREMGYRTAIHVNQGDAEEANEKLNTDLLYVGSEHFEGYYKSCAILVKAVFRQFDTDIVVVAGDDMWPDPSKGAHEIGAEFVDRFPDTFGVMQPIGDRFPRTIHEICGSPWIGRDFATRMYGGDGPWCLEYFHFYGDQELRDVALGMDVLWQRKDLSQYHDHWTRRRVASGCGQPSKSRRPAYLEKSQSRWGADQDLYKQRKADGFPGSAPKEA